MDRKEFTQAVKDGRVQGAYLFEGVEKERKKTLFEICE